LAELGFGLLRSAAGAAVLQRGDLTLGCAIQQEVQRDGQADDE
jgi:hypothetical protein